ncbi:MAG TPA: DUF1064 domain-containing protein [Acidovorax sp.]
MSGALHMTMAELTNLQARIAGRKSTTEMRDQPAEREKRGQKYGNTKVVDGAHKFDSKAEHKRWQYLALLERAGEIRELRMQVPFVLIPAQVSPSGKKERPTVYLADFTYTDASGALVVEDVKGAVTPEFRLKRKLLLWVHGIEIQEIRS